jgi:uncharacterized protein (DUF58 family)
VAAANPASEGSVAARRSSVRARRLALYPDRRLVVLIAVWVVAAAVSVAVPPFSVLTWIAGVALLLVLLADALRLATTPALVLSRRLPERLEVGRASRFEIRLHNPGKRRVRARIVDEVPVDLAPQDPDYPSIEIEGGERCELAYDVAPRIRGDRALGPLIALMRSPYGLLVRRVIAGEGQTLRVHPSTERFLRPDVLSPRRVLASLGVKPARQRGEGMDFESLREYVPGDDPRRIDWRATARKGRLVSRLYQHEQNHTVMIAVDASRLMGGRVGSDERTKLDAAVDCALALAYAALYAGDRCGLGVFDSEMRLLLEPRTRRADLGAFVDALSPVESRLVEADYRVLVRALLARRQKRSLVVILTDFAATDARAMVAPLSLLARRHRVLLVALRDRNIDALDHPVQPGEPEESSRLYRDIVLDDLLREREETLSRLRRQGLHTLDLVPEAVTASVLNRYLALRYAEA